MMEKITEPGSLLQAQATLIKKVGRYFGIPWKGLAEESCCSVQGSLSFSHEKLQSMPEFHCAGYNLKFSDLFSPRKFAKSELYAAYLDFSAGVGLNPKFGRLAFQSGASMFICTVLPISHGVVTLDASDLASSMLVGHKDLLKDGPLLVTPIDDWLKWLFTKPED